MNRTEYVIGLAGALNDSDELKQLSATLFGSEIQFLAQNDPSNGVIPFGHVFCYNAREENGDVELLPVIEVFIERTINDGDVEIEAIRGVNTEKSRYNADKYMTKLSSVARDIIGDGVDEGMKQGTIQSLSSLTAMPEPQDEDVMSWLELNIKIKKCKLGE